MAGALKRAQGIFKAVSKGARPLTPEQLHALSGLFHHRQLALWKHDPEALKLWEQWREEINEDDSVALPKGYADELLAGEGVVTDPDSILRL